MVDGSRKDSRQGLRRTSGATVSGGDGARSIMQCLDLAAQSRSDAH